jgi:hypothetical protein
MHSRLPVLSRRRPHRHALDRTDTVATDATAIRGRVKARSNSKTCEGACAKRLTKEIDRFRRSTQMTSAPLKAAVRVIQLSAFRLLTIRGWKSIVELAKFIAPHA